MSTTLSFRDYIRSKCQNNPGEIALPEAWDPRILKAASQMIKEQSFKRVFCFNREAVEKTANDLQINMKDLEGKLVFVEEEHPKISNETAEFYKKYLELKNKPSDSESIKHFSENILSQTGILLQNSLVDSALAGAVYNTSDVIRAAISSVGLRAGLRTVSGCFFMNRHTAQEDLTLLFADCGVVIDPKAKQLVDIAAASVESFKKVLPDVTPRVAFLSFSTKGSAAHPKIEKVQEAFEIFSQQFPNVEADGEIQFDAAVDEEIRKRKSPDSKLTGNANIFIFPDLNAGNICYKTTQRLGGFQAYGPLLQGIAKPFSDLSRGSTVDDIVYSAYLNYLLR